MIVTMDIWRVRRAAVPLAVLNMARHRRIRRTAGCQFAKLLGTGTGRTFTPRDADARQWAILAVWSDAEDAQAFRLGHIARQWQRISEEHAAFDLMPLSSHGTWSGHEPFGSPAPRRSDRPVVAITRARIAWRKNLLFWSAVPPVTTSLHQAPGLMAAIGIGEAPLGLQGTFSLWDSDAALREFAYRDRPHADVITRTHQEQWYAEELFARFEVLAARGVLRGRSLDAPAG
jgi:heme-degrading monooxygenase HmoA